jgi:hypothetical protein
MVFAQDVYISENLFTISWGEEPGNLSTAWNQPDDDPGYEVIDYYPPGPWAVTSMDGLIIVEENEDFTDRLVKFEPDGTFSAAINLRENGFPYPHSLSVNDNDQVLLMSWSNNEILFFLFDANLQYLNDAVIPAENVFEGDVFKSSTNSFYVLFSTINPRMRYFVEYFPDGTITEPQVIFEGTPENTDDFHRFVTPTGETKPELEDLYGFRYFLDAEYEPKLDKISPGDEVIYSHTFSSTLGYTQFDIPNWMINYFIDWSGDFYTLHATESGAVLTKYDLHVDPVCDLLVVTPRPHTGPSPVAIEFDASGTYDDDGDTLTFHWDFDGDKVFDEPIDDAYTGDPSNPTHEYTADYDGPVNLRVTDNYQGECDIAVILSVDVQ